MPSYSQFKGVSHIGEATLCEQLKTNLKSYLDWALLGIGGWYNVDSPQTGIYGGRQDILRLVDDTYYTEGQVWEGFRKDWVWETGVEYQYQPIAISGVYVDDTFFPSNTTGEFSHHINYPLGQVIFDEPIDATSEVRLSYSYRYVQVYTNDAPWFQKIQFNSLRVDDTHFLQQGSGEWDTLAENRVQLPAIIVEPVPRRSLVPLQIGGGQWVYTDVNFYVIAENSWERDKLFDILTYQKEKRLLLFDKNDVTESGLFPLNISGELVDDPIMYPDLVTGEYWKTTSIKDMRSGISMDNYPIYKAKIIGTFEVDFPEI